MISLTRVYSFSASHRLHSPHLTDAENAAMFGKCNNPYGHGHNYVLSVTASGEVNEETGLLLPVSRLDRLVETQVLHVFAHRNVNLDVPQFRDLVPTTENMALVIAQLLQVKWDAYLSGINARVTRVHIQETDRNGFEVRIPVVSRNESTKSEGALTHA